MSKEIGTLQTMPLPSGVYSHSSPLVRVYQDPLTLSKQASKDIYCISVRIILILFLSEERGRHLRSGLDTFRSFSH